MVKPCSAAAHRQYYAENRERASRWSQYYAENKEQLLEARRRYQDENREELNEQSRQWRQRIRQAVFDHYGWSCACCGTTKISVDHVNGDGRRHREELGIKTGGMTQVYSWLIANRFPPGFQTLCGPCNSSKADGERCRLAHGSVAP